MSIWNCYKLVTHQTKIQISRLNSQALIHHQDQQMDSYQIWTWLTKTWVEEGLVEHMFNSIQIHLITTCPKIMYIPMAWCQIIIQIKTWALILVKLIVRLLGRIWIINLAITSWWTTTICQWIILKITIFWAKWTST